MIVILVHVYVKPESINEFIEATKENARNSILEEGIARFDFIQQLDQPTRFTLIEAFHNQESQTAHRETTHYLKWRDAVADMMAEPRVGVKHVNIFPDDAKWG